MATTKAVKKLGGTKDLRLALRASQPIRATQAVMAVNPEKLDKVEEQRITLEKELEHQRRQYSWWKGIFEDTKAQAELLANIKKKGEAVKLEIAALPQYPTIRELAKEDEEDVVDTLLLMLLWLDAQFNIAASLTESQMQTIAVTIVAKYGMLRIEDVTVAFSKAIRGEYGTVYNRIDVAIVLDWVNKYQATLLADKTEMQERVHISAKGNPQDDRIGRRIGAV